MQQQLRHNVNLVSICAVVDAISKEREEEAANNIHREKKIDRHKQIHTCTCIRIHALASVCVSRAVLPCARIFAPLLCSNCRMLHKLELFVVIM